MIPSFFLVESNPKSRLSPRSPYGALRVPTDSFWLDAYSKVTYLCVCVREEVCCTASACHIQALTCSDGTCRSVLRTRPRTLVDLLPQIETRQSLGIICTFRPRLEPPTSPSILLLNYCLLIINPLCAKAPRTSIQQFLHQQIYPYPPASIL